ncbi:hypothetical protein DL95DRAFT_406038 [Leptodontidium sp. 2 PMI_412]|nr:hypothetical protein DL95DRAFT_406038 [Leptodontidium sp. 2 PMI_412]
MGIESLDKLHHLLVSSESHLQAMNRNRILNSLKFDGMGSSYQDVSLNTPRTFNWCLQDLEMPVSHPELEISFQEWLNRDTGIYHISGKPGAGKSTLMKFLVEHEDTQRYLKNKESPWEVTTDLEIHYSKLLAAFERLIGSMEVIKDHCFCFFIDGLDEFEDRDVEHIKLVNQLKSWTEGSSQNCKICVSSREENAFINNFLADQRLRLHLLTMDDVRKTVECSLNHINFTEHNTPEDCQRLVELLVNKAEGAFLWVRLVLHKLGEDLEVSRSLVDLRETLEHVPKELGDLFLTLLTSNDQRHQQEAWAIVAVLMAADKHDITLLSIFDYSFIKDFFRNDRLSETLEIAALMGPQIIARQDKYTLHLNRLLKGLLEVGRERNYDMEEERLGEKYRTWNTNYSHNSFQGSVKVIHRSVYEFLKTDFPHAMTMFIHDLDVKSVVLQCIIAHVKLVRWDSLMFKMFGKRFIEPCLAWLNSPCSEKHLEQLGILDFHLLQFQGGGMFSNEVNLLTIPNFALLHIIGLAALCKCLLDGILNEHHKGPVELLQQLSGDGFITSELLAFRMGSSSKISVFGDFACQIGFGFMRGRALFAPSGKGAEALEILLRFEVDPRLIFNIHGNSEDDPESRASSPRPYVIESIGIRAGYYYSIRLIPEAEVTFRDLVEVSGWKNRKKLLRLIDKNLALCASLTNCLATITEIEEVEAEDTQEDTPSGAETEKSVEVSTLNTTDHGWPMYSAAFWTLPVFCLVVWLVCWSLACSPLS